MNDLSITVIQSDLEWEDRTGNLAHFERLLLSVTAETDLILLPETFNTGFSINPSKCAETMEGPTVKFLRDMAARKNTTLMATLIISDGALNVNRMICMRPDGTFDTYDKRHLFRLSDEYKIFNAGKKREVFNVKGWNILPVICYDLRFPVWSKNTYIDGRYEYDLLVCLANWPASRAHLWKTLLMARGIENQVYAAGVNRIGRDGHGTWHSGDSMVVDAKGNVMFAADPGNPVIHTITLSAEDLMLFRESLTVGLDWDKFSININN